MRRRCLRTRPTSCRTRRRRPTRRPAMRRSFSKGRRCPSAGGRRSSSDEIDHRVDQALAHSPTIASAQAALKQAQENVSAANGGLFPSIDANVGAQRGNANFFGQLAPGQSVFNVYNGRRQRQLHARSLRRRAPRHRGAVGRRGLPAVPARRHVSDARGERRHDELPRSVAARPDRGDRRNHRRVRGEPRISSSARTRSARSRSPTCS